MVTVVVPAMHEPLLEKTVDGLWKNAAGQVEVIPVVGKGLREAVNIGLTKGKGEWFMKIDAHCAVAPGYDEVLVKDCDDDCVMFPARYSLDDITFSRDERRSVRRSHFLAFPAYQPRYGFQLSPQTSKVWDAKMGTADIQESMTFQGSCWFVNKDYFLRTVGLLNEKKFGFFEGEYLEIGLNYWLKGGSVKVNNKTWYAHLRKMPRHFDSGLYQKKSWDRATGLTNVTKHFMNDQEPGTVHRFEWLVDKFWPIPTWPEKWQEVWSGFKV